MPAFSLAGDDAGHMRATAGCRENSSESDMEYTERGLRYLLAAILLLRLTALINAEVADLMPHRCVLRNKQQKN
jgi:hypothetical protein